MAAAAALAVIDTIEKEGLLANATEVGAVLQDGLADPRVTEIRGEGLLIGLDLTEPVAGKATAAALARASSSTTAPRTGSGSRRRWC